MWDSFTQRIGNSTREVFELLVSWLDQHLISIAAVIIFAIVIQHIAVKAITRIIEQTTHRKDLFPTETDRKKRVKTLNSLVNAVVRVVVWLVAIIIIVSELGINATPLIASAGIIGAALGFGAQSLIKDFMSGFFIIIENQYRVGDVIRVDDVSGTVEAIGMRTTVLRDLDGKVHHVPNGAITVTTNMTMNYAQINEDIAVGLDTNIEQLEHIINHVGEQIAADANFKNAVIEPPHIGRVVGFDRDGITVKVLAKTVAGEQWRVNGELYKRLKKSFDTHNIEIPHTQITLHKAKSGSK